MELMTKFSWKIILIKLWTEEVLRLVMQEQMNVSYLNFYDENRIILQSCNIYSMKYSIIDSHQKLLILNYDVWKNIKYQTVLNLENISKFTRNMMAVIILHEILTSHVFIKVLFSKKTFCIAFSFSLFFPRLLLFFCPSLFKFLFYFNF